MRVDITMPYDPDSGLFSAVARLLGTALLLSVVSPLGAESASELRSEFMGKARALDAEINRYFDAREHEDDALAELRRVSRLLDETLGDPHSGPADLVTLESQVAVARDRAFALSEESAELRRGMYDNMKSLADLARQLERQGIPLAGESRQVGGSWQVEAQPNDVWGFLELSQEGTLVNGSYRLSNGAQGSVRGSFTGGRLELELVDSERGAVGAVKGELDPESGAVQGTWHARELASGRPTAGKWTARRVSVEQD